MPIVPRPESRYTSGAGAPPAPIAPPWEYGARAAGNRDRVLHMEVCNVDECLGKILALLGGAEPLISDTAEGSIQWPPMQAGAPRCHSADIPSQGITET